MPNPLGGGGRDLFDPVQTANGLFNDEDNPLLDLLRTRTRVSHPDHDHIQIEFRKHLLLNTQC